jgi:hypothetical protein
MSGLHELEPRFDATNTLALAVLGLVEVAAGVARSCDVGPEPHETSREPDVLEYALLGLMAIGERLSAIEPEVVPAVDRAWTTEDLLR